MAFPKGQSGNPGGRPKGLSEVRDLARKHTAEAIGRLVSVMRDSESDQAAAFAANSILDRGWGKPTQPLSGDDDGAPIRVDLTKITDDALAAIATGGGEGASGKAARSRKP